MQFDSLKVRRPPKGFGWVDRRIVTEGHLGRMSQVETAIYLVLCVVADRHGISYYRPDTLGKLVKLPVHQVQEALESLATRGFLALEGRFVQVVDLNDREPDPEKCRVSPVPVPADQEVSDQPPVRIAGRILDEFPETIRNSLLNRARARLKPILGGRSPSESALQAMAFSIWREEAS